MKDHERWFRSGVAMAALSAVMVQAGAAPGQTPQKNDPLVFKAEVSLVAVPVFVTDKSGRAIAGLESTDFEIEEDGRKKPIMGFHAVNVDEPWPDEDVDGLSVPLAVRAEAPRQFVVLLDLEYTPPGGLFFGRKAAVDFLRNGLAPSDLVAVMRRVRAASRRSTTSRPTTSTPRAGSKDRRFRAPPGRIRSASGATAPLRGQACSARRPR